MKENKIIEICSNAYQKSLIALQSLDIFRDLDKRNEIIKIQNQLLEICDIALSGAISLDALNSLNNLSFEDFLRNKSVLDKIINSSKVTEVRVYLKRPRVNQTPSCANMSPFYNLEFIDGNYYLRRIDDINYGLTPVTQEELEKEYLSLDEFIAYLEPKHVYARKMHGKIVLLYTYEDYNIYLYNGSLCVSIGEKFKELQPLNKCGMYKDLNFIKTVINKQVESFLQTKKGIIGFNI